MEQILTDPAKARNMVLQKSAWHIVNQLSPTSTIILRGLSFDWLTQGFPILTLGSLSNKNKENM